MFMRMVGGCRSYSNSFFEIAPKGPPVSLKLLSIYVPCEKRKPRIVIEPLSRAKVMKKIMREYHDKDVEDDASRSGSFDTISSKFKGLFENMRNEKPNSIGRRVWEAVNPLVNGSDYREDFMIRSADFHYARYNLRVTFLIPEHVSEVDFCEDVYSICKKRSAYHSGRSRLFFLGLPFTLAFAIIPLPNVPFFWCLYRLYRHIYGYMGATNLAGFVAPSNMKNLAFEKYDTQKLQEIMATVSKTDPDFMSILVKAADPVAEQNKPWYF